MEETEKLLTRRMRAEAECRQALAEVKDAKRAAEAKLAAAEEELTSLKALHRGEPRTRRFVSPTPRNVILCG